MKRALLLLSILPTMTHAMWKKTTAPEEIAPPVAAQTTEKNGNPANRSDQIPNPSADPRAKHGGHVFVIGEALYWRASENGLSPFTINSVQDNAIANAEARASRQRVKNLDFKWDWGWRGTLGSNLPHDQWDLSLAWTHLHTTAHKTAKELPVITPNAGSAATGELILPSWSLPVPSIISLNQFFRVTAIAAKWKLDFNLVDLDLGRKFFVSKWLTLRPNVAVRGAVIDQKYKIAYTGLNLILPPPTLQFTTLADAVKMKNEFRGIGLLAGLDTQWGLFNELSIYGNGAISVLYGRFHIDQKEAVAVSTLTLNGTTSAADAVKIRDRFHNAKAIADLAFGLRWDHFFAGGRLHLDMHVGWEYHVFFGQNQLKQYIVNAAIGTSPPQANAVPLNQDLTLQGGVAGMRLDF